MSLALRYINCNSLARIAPYSDKLLNVGVETIEDIRHRNLVALIGRFETQAAFCAVVGKDTTQVSQWVTRAPNSKTGTPRTPSSETCRDIEDRVGEPRGWMDHDHSKRATPELPLYHQTILDLVDRMSEAERRAFHATGAALAEPSKPKRAPKRRAG